MAEFKIIETQEQLDAILKDRLERERKTVESRFSDYDAIKSRNAELETQLSDLQSRMDAQASKYQGYDDQIAALTQTVRDHETASAKTRIALETGLPYELASRLNGSTDEELRADAANIKKLIGTRAAAPLASTEPVAADPKAAAWQTMLNNLGKEE